MKTEFINTLLSWCKQNDKMHLTVEEAIYDYFEEYLEYVIVYSHIAEHAEIDREKRCINMFIYGQDYDSFCKGLYYKVPIGSITFDKAYDMICDFV